MTAAPGDAGIRPRTAAARPRTAAIVNLGCKVNQSEMEGAARLLREARVPLIDPDRSITSTIATPGSSRRFSESILTGRIRSMVVWYQPPRP